MFASPFTAGVSRLPLRVQSGRCTHSRVSAEAGGSRRAGGRAATSHPVSHDGGQRRQQAPTAAAR